MNVLNLMMKLPMVISMAMNIVEKVKGAKGAEKKDAVLAAIPESVELAELLAGRDLLNDPVVKGLISDYVDAEAIVINVKKRLQDVLVAKSLEPAVAAGQVTVS